MSSSCGPECFKPGVSAKGDEFGGAIVDFHGIQSYVVGTSKEKAIVYITDVFGLSLKNHFANAATYAKAGFTVVIPNVLNDALDPSKPLDFSAFPAWLARNPVEGAIKTVEAVVSHLVKDGYTSIGAVGFCYGAKPVVHLLQTNEHVKVGVLAHPSFLAKGDGAKIKKGSHLLVNAAEKDSIYVPELRADFEAGAKSVAATFRVIDYANTEHGFACRPANDAGIKIMHETAGHSATFFATYA